MATRFGFYMRPLTAVVAFSAALSPAHSNEAHRILSGMTDSSRRSAFATMLRNSGESCDSVKRTFFRGSDKNDYVYWSVTCSSGKSFQIQ